ncbi:DEAD/DEAH box helicase family protein [Knoellia sp. CPCC 206450]|uniref:DEAD/DEAH box helicase family protein n=1 Tax=Knoellia tibetensis TaxID=3404798 RepID=UPI003B42B319
MTVDVEVAPGHPRMTKRFTWEAVDARLTLRLLEVAYLAEGRPDEADKLSELDRDGLVRQATRALGRPLNKRHMPSVGPVLRDQWLPNLKRVQLYGLARLVQLSLSGPDRTAALGTKGEILAFFQRRNLTETFLANLHSLFVSHYKRPAPVVGPGGVSGRRNAEPILLEGQGAVDRRMPFDHQRDAWAKLDDMAGARVLSERAGLLVLPTGAGKTFTMVAWLLRQLGQDPSLRVLWLADQQELVDQSARAFADHAATLAVGDSRVLRVVHGGAGSASALGDGDVDVLCATRQSVLGGGFAEASQRRLGTFLTRPTIVVVDEAHHAVSPTYRKLLDFIQDTSPATLLVGLTATPWPRGADMTALLRKRFPVTVADVQTRDLVKSGVLARPQLHTVPTGESLNLTDEQVRQIAGRDLPPSVLRALDREGRNHLIVDAWIERQDEWGKTLVFACDIKHADHLGALFRAAGVATTVVHSRAEVDRGQELARFRRSEGNAVLVSVGMLLEGVDVPDARTAFLTRPTSSPIVMRQMIGRVLRGVAGGGEEIAHVVDLRDRWSHDVDVLSPVNIADLPGQVHTHDGGEHRLPPVRDEVTGEPIPEDVLERIARAYRDIHSAFPYAGALESTDLIGFYELGYLNVPVFRHALPRWEEVITEEVSGGGYLRPVEMFDDLPVPQPVTSDIRAVIEYCRAQRVSPPLAPVRASMSIAAIVRDLRAAGPLEEGERMSRLRAVYETSLARSAFGSFHQFFDAVQQELLATSTEGPRRGNPESVTSAAPTRRAKPRLSRRKDRDLQPLYRSAAARGRKILEVAAPEQAHLLQVAWLPTAAWTHQPLKGTWAHWSVRLQGRSRGTPVIRVNAALQAPRTQVSDEVLEYLLWHELVHHVLPGRGHDAEFRRLESEWPDFARLDHELDSINERFDLSHLFGEEV